MKRIVDLLKQTFSEWQEDKASRLAAALAYYTAFSLAPLVIIIVGLISFFFDQQTASQYLVEQIQTLVGQRNGELIQSIIQNNSQPTSSLIATLIGVGTLVFGATGVFAQLQDSLNTVWGVAPRPDKGLMKIIETRFTSLTVVLGIGFLLLVSLMVSIVLSAVNSRLFGWIPDNLAVGHVLNLVVSFGVITLLFALIYKLLPDVKMEWSDVWMGAAVTAGLFALGKFLLSFYIGSQSFDSTYGAAGSLLVLLLWVYYSAQIFLFGAEFTQVYAKKYGSRLVPDADAIPLTAEMRARQGIPRRQEVEEIMALQSPGTSAAGRSSSQTNDTRLKAAPTDRFLTVLVGLFMAGIFLRALFTSPHSSKSNKIVL
ncbi:MAG TPA: YihY/virulence factor BrkB family protein [Anaerolineae bacterium]|nr:YihY/virulence factor BrkB family protein [Anaerolineae bacterium]MCB0223424.1 YihY/virulence factor BrkB family protein [Anaerolineae bacterium]MCB9103857.1 YihY/virulence factor BrkB family protein [Anaerolineales bacterium]HRV94735.1 YihY/virulence factor BrkB family protein [Anaerolineae bacterium]